MDWLGLVLLYAGAAWIVYVFLGYPAALWIGSCLSRSRRDLPGDFLPTASVLIAARNERKDIEWKIRETLAWDYPPERLEVLVASDASDDGTDEIVRAINDPRVILVRMPRRGGKVRALNRLASLSLSEVLVFTDANAHIGPQALRWMARHFVDPQVGCVTGRTCSAESADPVGAGARIYWDYEAVVAGLESRLGAVLVCDGAIHCARREVVCEFHPDLANDLELPVRVRALGYRSVFEPLAVANEAETESTGEEYARRRRICGQGALALWRLRDRMSFLMGWQFVSRKLLRWLILVPLLLVLTGSMLLAATPVYAAVAMLQVAFSSMAAVVHLLPASTRAFGGWFAAPYYMLLGAFGALRGVADTVGGRRFDVWDVAALSRGQ